MPYSEILELLKANSSLFPVEVDLSQNAFQYKSTMFLTQVFIFLFDFITQNDFCSHFIS